MINKPVRVLVGMSGGVDSSVAAALLVEQGVDVTGAFMKQWSDTKDVSGLCSWKQDRRDALRVAAHLGIPLLTLDFEQEYRESVMSYLFTEYSAGRTPNPDVLCNKDIKFGAWLRTAQRLGFSHLATGHYAQIQSSTKEGITQYQLLSSVDEEKDQTYFLHQLNQEQLAHTLFPIGGYTKKQVRELAKKYHLPTADRAESMGICFVGEMPMKQFLEQKIPHTPGDIRMSTGEIIGTHDGLAFYTIGQRHGFEQVGGGRPLFVVQKKFAENQLIVGYDDDPLLYTKEVLLDTMDWVSGQTPTLPLHCRVRTRHRQPLQEATIVWSEEKYSLLFLEKQKAITPGQFAVLYHRDACLGGGIIS